MAKKKTDIRHRPKGVHVPADMRPLSTTPVYSEVMAGISKWASYRRTTTPRMGGGRRRKPSGNR